MKYKCIIITWSSQLPKLYILNEKLDVNKIDKPIINRVFNIKITKNILDRYSNYQYIKLEEMDI